MTGPQDPFAAPDPDAPPAPPPAPVGYGQPAYGQAPYGAASAAPRNGLGTAALVCGVLAVVLAISVVGGILLGLVAVVLGVVGRGRAKRNEATNGGSATAGIVLGVIGLVLSGALIAFGVSLLNTDSGKKLRDCLAGAGSDQAAQQACQQEFQKDYGR